MAGGDAAQRPSGGHGRTNIGPPPSPPPHHGAAPPPETVGDPAAAMAADMMAAVLSALRGCDATASAPGGTGGSAIAATAAAAAATTSATYGAIVGGARSAPAAPPGGACLPRTSRKRKARAPSPRQTSGAAGPVLLGVSRVVRSVGPAASFGTVISYCRPWYEIRIDGGASLKLQGADLARHLIFAPNDFFDPALFHYDFGVLNPLSLPGWVSAMHDYLSEYNVSMPRAWLDHSTASTRGDFAGPHAVAREAMKADMQSYLLDLAGESRAQSTLEGMRNPGLKAIWWLAANGRPLPPTADDVAEYLAFLCRTVNTIGSVACARDAISYMCVLNGWGKDAIMGGRARVPLEAIRRRHVHVIHKAAGLTAAQARAIMNAFCVVHQDRPWHQQWHLAVGIGVGCLPFKILARYDDVSQLRYDAGYFRYNEHMVEMICRTRKNNMWISSTLYVARPPNDEMGVYHWLIIGSLVFGGGYIVPHIGADGTVHRETPMGYDEFVRHLRHCLHYSLGFSVEEASSYTGHSARAGGGTTAAQAGLQPHEICHLAGVRDINWLLTYMRSSLEDRLRASWALGL